MQMWKSLGIILNRQTSAEIKFAVYRFDFVQIHRHLANAEGTKLRSMDAAKVEENAICSFYFDYIDFDILFIFWLTRIYK